MVSAPAPEFERRGTAGSLSWATLVPVRTLGANIGLEWQSLPWRKVLACDVLVVPDSLRTISNLAALLLRWVARKPVVTWGHGVNYQASSTSKFLTVLRGRILRTASRALLYTNRSVGPMLVAGHPIEKLFVVGNAADVRGSAGLSPRHPDVLAFRKAHSLGDRPVVAFLGSWYRTKRPGLIIKIANTLQAAIPGLTVLVIGAGDELAKILAKDTPGIRILGVLHEREKFVALASARCLIVSGVAGLNILDAMAVGVPVILPLRVDHSPEAAYVLDQINGRIVDDDVASISLAAKEVCLNDAMFSRLSANARAMSEKLTIPDVAANLYRCARKSVSYPALDQPASTVAVIYQRMLPYHVARFNAIQDTFLSHGRKAFAFSVAEMDLTYGRIDDAIATFSSHSSDVGPVICLFPGANYINLSPRDVARGVRQALRSIGARVVFAPAPAFSEGAGALHYKVINGGRLIIMDDAWEATDHRGLVTRAVKRMFYKLYDGGFLPAKSHAQYFDSLNIPLERQRYGVDVVGRARDDAAFICPYKKEKRAPLMFVGRLVRRKRLDVVLHALAEMGPRAPALVVIGDGPERTRLVELAETLGLKGRIDWLGRMGNAEVLAWMKRAVAIVIPSESEQWGLVVNEAWAAQTIVLGSNTVGALCATSTPITQWTSFQVGDISDLRRAIERAIEMSSAERARLLEIGLRNSKIFSVETHAASALELAELPLRPRPSVWVQFGALIWVGRVATW